ncbi:hypothetical protein ACFWIQ_08345 [Kitasatospora sp. NPDC127059]|uniref:hypothetical protein n=1 Tax=unclassified Kitasatospora TaxID=2633591 RepID=UPI0036699204
MILTLPNGTQVELHLPPAADLLTQHPGAVPAPERLITDGWLTPVTTQLLRLLDQTDPHTLADGSHLGPGHALLLIAEARRDRPALYLRLPDGVPAPARAAAHTTIAFPLIGTLDLTLYRDQEDVGQRQPQYLRTLNPGQLCTIHTGATVELTGAADSVQLVLTRHPITTPDARKLAPAEYQVALKEARTRLTRPGPNRNRPPGTRPEDIPGLLGADLPKIHAQLDALHHLAADRNALSYLVTTAALDYERFEASRTTLLLDRIVLCARPDHGVEIRLNTNPRPGNQRLPHNHAYPLGARVLTGGYVHAVSYRTDGWNTGPFTSDQLRPAVTTTELPGSSYTLAPTLVHQALMRPDTTTLMLRGPYTSTAHAATDLLPPVSAWPASVDGAAPTHSRPMTDAEHRALHGALAAAGVIDLLPRARSRAN